MESAHSFLTRLWRKKWSVLGVVLLIGATWLLVFSRTYELEQSIFFQNDIGRDYSVLEDWRRTGKPPLLGPQTNFIPFNHSPVYFYILYPSFLILDGAPTATAWAAAVCYGVAILIAFVCALKLNALKLLVPICFFIFVAIGHPQLVIAGRYVWNPTFVPLCIYFALLALYAGIDGAKKSSIFWAGVLAGIAAGFNLSAISVILGILIGLIYAYRQYLSKFLYGLMVGLAGVYAPILLFELRHGWQISQRLLHAMPSATMGSSSFPQLSIDSVWSILHYVIGISGNTGMLILAILVVSGIYTVHSKRAENAALWWIVVLTAVLFLICLPIKLEYYYLLPVIAACFFAVAVALHRTVQIILGMVFAWCWASAWWQGAYTSLPPRSAAAVYSCGEMVCKQLTAPTAVAVTASFHGYHAGPEFQYVLKKNGCTVQPVFDPNSTAKTLVVFADQTNFSIPQDMFEEVRVFGPTTSETIVHCAEGITAHILAK